MPCSGAILWLQWCYCAPGHGSAWRKVLDHFPVLLSVPYLIWQWFFSAGCPSALKCAVLTPFWDMETESFQSSSLRSVLQCTESAGVVNSMLLCVGSRCANWWKKPKPKPDFFVCFIVMVMDLNGESRGRRKFTALQVLEPLFSYLSWSLLTTLKNWLLLLK